MVLFEYSTLIMSVFGVFGTSIAIYEWAVINESKKRKGEFQYLLASINNLAIRKQTTWQTQLSLFGAPQTPEEWSVAQLYCRARDEFSEFSGLAVALEGSIDSGKSAITAMTQKSIELIKLGNVLQTEGLKNPLNNSQGKQNEAKHNI